MIFLNVTSPEMDDQTLDILAQPFWELEDTH